MAGKQREVVLRFFAEPTDVNFRGKMFGGAVMSWIDHAGYAAATTWAGRYCVTAHVGGIQFERPISIGELVEARARVVLTGRTSMHVAVEIRSRVPTQDDWAVTTRCMMVFVALDDSAEPTAVPTFDPVTEVEQRDAAYARTIQQLGRQFEAKRPPWCAETVDCRAD